MQIDSASLCSFFLIQHLSVQRRGWPVPTRLKLGKMSDSDQSCMVVSHVDGTCGRRGLLLVMDCSWSCPEGFIAGGRCM